MNWMRTWLILRLNHNDSACKRHYYFNINLNTGFCVQKKLFSSLNDALACQLISQLLSHTRRLSFTYTDIQNLSQSMSSWRVFIDFYEFVGIDLVQRQDIASFDVHLLYMVHICTKHPAESIRRWSTAE